MRTKDPESAEIRTEGRIRALIEKLLILLGENPEREGLRGTPNRVEKVLKFLTAGYRQDLDRVLNGARFTVEHDEMVVVRDIDFAALCEHHLLPFFGKCHIAYIPNKKVLGLSKIPRIVEMFARRLQLQERMTTEIAHALNKGIDPAGVAVVIEAQHLCMMIRGVEKQNTKTITSSMLGVFKSDPKTRGEFLDLIRREKNS